MRPRPQPRPPRERRLQLFCVPRAGGGAQVQPLRHGARVCMVARQGAWPRHREEEWCVRRTGGVVWW